MHVEPFGLKGGVVVRDCLKTLPHGVEMFQAFFEAKIGHVVRAELVAQESGELLVLFEEGILKVGAENVVAVLDPIEDGVKLAAKPFGQAYAENLGDLLAGHALETDFAGAFEDFADREVLLENEVATVFNLGQGVGPAHVHLLALAAGELGAEHKGPILQTLADDLGAEPIGGSLQRFRVCDGEEGVVVFVKGDVEPQEFPEQLTAVIWKGRAVNTISQLRT